MPHCSKSHVGAHMMIFLSMLDDFALVQKMDEPTRFGYILDLFLTSKHTLVQNIQIVSSIADHDSMVADVK